jgi:hypothetical protein
VYSLCCQINQNLRQGRTASDVKLMQMDIMTQLTNIPAQVPHFLSGLQYGGQFSLVYLTNPRFQNNGRNRAVPFVKRHQCNLATPPQTHMSLVFGLQES